MTGKELQQLAEGTLSGQKLPQAGSGVVDLKSSLMVGDGLAEGKQIGDSCDLTSGIMIASLKGRVHDFFLCSQMIWICIVCIITQIVCFHQKTNVIYKDGWDMKKQDIEALLETGYSVRIRPQGYSMYPLFVPGRDEAVIEPLKDRHLKRGDVVLYRREGSILVLHRIWRCRPEGYYMVGDNQKETEGPLKKSQVRGILTGVIRNGRFFETAHPLYRVLSGIWLRLRPFRPFLSRLAAGIRRHTRW